MDAMIAFDVALTVAIQAHCVAEDCALASWDVWNAADLAAARAYDAHLASSGPWATVGLARARAATARRQWIAARSAADIAACAAEAVYKAAI